jgi:serine/threonine protein kinase
MNSITGGVGTAFYMAPEQQFGNVSRAKSSYSSKADIFSLGVLLFEMFMLKVRHFNYNILMPKALFTSTIGVTYLDVTFHAEADRLYIHGTS